MEPMNCTVKISADRAECWVPTQNAEASLAALSEQSGVPLDRCEVYRHDLGGGFGRRGGTQDFVRQATLIAKQFPDVPVKTVWSREEDMGTTSTGRSRSASWPPASTTRARWSASTCACPVSRSTRSRTRR